MVDTSGKLIARALAAPDDVSEVRDSDGQWVSIERDPEVPGSHKLTSFAADGVADGRVTIATAAEAASRPVFYPDDMPFLTGLDGLLIYLDGTLQMATWFGSASGMKERAQHLKASAEAMSQRVAAVPKPIKGEDPEEMRAKMRAWMDSLGDADRRDLSHVGDSIRATDAAREAMDARLADLVAPARSDGWTLVKDESPMRYPPTRIVELHKRNRIRSVARTEVLGAMQMMLREVPREG